MEICQTIRPVRVFTERPGRLFYNCGPVSVERSDQDRVSGLPHAVVKQAEKFRARELVKKIESHPHRRALQADLKTKQKIQPIQ